MNTEAIAEISKRLADIDDVIATKTAEMRHSALKAVFDKGTATSRAKVKQDLVSLEIDRDDLRAALAQAQQMDADETAAGEAAQRLAKQQERRKRIAIAAKNLHGAADQMDAAVASFIEAAKILAAPSNELPVAQRTICEMMPRRMVQKTVHHLREAGVLQTYAFRVEDPGDHLLDYHHDFAALLKKTVVPPEEI
ncbi:hypothetical protein LMIY3S_04760 [Labrys miyagiensis]